MKIALGSAQFGLDYGLTNRNGKVSTPELKKILCFARSMNIDTIDTSANYGDSEKALGDHDLSSFKIVTKTLSLQNGVHNVKKGFEESLNNLRLKNVYGLLIHNIKDTRSSDFESLFELLTHLKNDGLIDSLGFSVYSPEDVKHLLNHYDFDLIQVPINVFDSRLIETDILNELKKKGVEIHARSIFLQGLLLNLKKFDPYFNQWKLQFEKYEKIVNKSGLNFLEYALNYVLSIEQIDRLILGVESKKQLSDICTSVKNNFETGAFPISDENLINPSLWKIQF